VNARRVFRGELELLKGILQTRSDTDGVEQRPVRVPAPIAVDQFRADEVIILAHHFPLLRRARLAWPNQSGPF
jgi:hypothetical protein